MGAGHWELAQKHSAHGTSSVSLTQVHLSSHIHILCPGPSQGQVVSFHEMMQTEFQPVNSFGGINQQKPLHFHAYAWYEGDVERRVQFQCKRWMSQVSPKC